MNDFAIEFEQYLTRRWMLAGKHYTIHGLYSFYSMLWNQDESELETPYGIVKVAERSTGYDEGQEERVMILQIGDRFFQKTGYYDSWESSNWNGSLVEVRPREKTVTVYETI